jgi:hypothetical protein
MNIFNNYLLGKVCVVGLGQPMFSKLVTLNNQYKETLTQKHCLFWILLLCARGFFGALDHNINYQQ